MTSGSSNRGLMMLQSGSGDAQGSNAYITVVNSSLTTTDDDVPLCEVPTLNTGTLTLTDATLSVASGVLMYVDYNTQWSTYGGTGNLILQTTEDSWNYVGDVEADSYSNATVTVGSNVTWNGTINEDNEAASANVTVASGAIWTLDDDAYVTTLVNNGTINCNGHTLSYGSLSGSGTINTDGGTTGIGDVQNDERVRDNRIFTLDGRCLGEEIPASFRGIYIQNGKKYVKVK